MTDKDLNIEVGSENVFEDLGFDNAREMLTKSSIAQAIATKIEQKGLSQAEAASVLNIDQPKVSYLVRGKLNAFSISRLMRFLTLLGTDIEIVLKDHGKNGKLGEVKVAFG